MFWPEIPTENVEKVAKRCTKTMRMGKLTISELNHMNYHTPTTHFGTLRWPPSHTTDKRLQRDLLIGLQRSKVVV